MTGDIKRRAAAIAAAKLEFDRAIVAARLSGEAKRRPILSLPFYRAETPLDAHPAAKILETRSPRQPPSRDA